MLSGRGRLTGGRDDLPSKRSLLCRWRVGPGFDPAFPQARGQPGMSGPVRIALVGLGWWGQKITAVLKAAPEEVTILRAVEPNETVARAFSATHGIPVTPDLETALADPQVEAVLRSRRTACTRRRLQLRGSKEACVLAKSPWPSRGPARRRPSRPSRAQGWFWRPATRGVSTTACAADRGCRPGRDGCGSCSFDATFSHDKFLSLDPSNWRLGASDAPAAA